MAKIVIGIVIVGILFALIRFLWSFVYGWTAIEVDELAPAKRLP